MLRAHLPVVGGAGISAFELGNCAATLLILRTTELLGPGRSAKAATTAALGLYVAYNATTTLTSLGAGRSTDRVVSPGSWPWVSSPSPSHTSASPTTPPPGRRCCHGSCSPASASAASRPPNTRPWLHMPRSSCAAPPSASSLASRASATSGASVIAGLLWTTLGPSWAFAYLATWMAIALLALIATYWSDTD